MVPHENIFPWLPLRLPAKRSFVRFSIFLSFLLPLTTSPLLPAYAAAPSVPFTVTMSEAVTIGSCSGSSCPYLSLNVDGNTRSAYCPTVTNSATLTCTYTATAGDLDLDGIGFVDTNLHANSISITDQNGNALTNFAFTPPANISAVKVSYPSLSMDFTNGTTGRYTLNGTAYTSLSSFLSAVGGTYTRASTATYFDSSGNLQTAAANTARFDYDPSTLSFKGLLIEEARTNSNRNSTMQGAVNGVLGSGGALPTYWQPFSSVAGITINVTGTGTENGLPYIDLNFTGTPTATQSPNFGFETGGAIAAASGQTWTGSIYHKLVSGSLTNTSAWTFEIVERTAAGGFLTSSITNITPSATRARAVVTRTFNNASTGSINTKINFAVSNGLAINFTLRLYAPQMEQGGFETSYIPTSGATATRPADNLIIPTGSWLNTSASTLYGYGSTAGYVSGSASTLADINDGGWNNRFQARYTAGYYSGIITSGAVVQSSLSNTSYTLNSVKGIALSSQVNDSVLYADGVQKATDSSVVMPVSQTQMRVGSVAGGTEYLNGWLQKIKYYPSRASNSQLQLLTQ